MKPLRSTFLPVSVWPWFMRWTLGLILLAIVIIPICTICAVFEALLGGFSAFAESRAWQTIGAGIGAIVFGGKEAKA